MLCACEWKNNELAAFPKTSHINLIKSLTFCESTYISPLHDCITEQLSDEPHQPRELAFPKRQFGDNKILSRPCFTYILLRYWVSLGSMLTVPTFQGLCT